ncbi:hypothetical protein BKA70DRAFT_668798 [Coprinopsis sp. MPI-PUGE-AT-0042]|nr:hypothetical protein BKA70DRAFT_668798 [Coprinopsis sp. MPI-PUGE-AT-0042]
MAECVRTPTATTSVPSVTQTAFTTTRTTESSQPTQFVTSTFVTERCGFDQEVSDTICIDFTSTTVRTIPGESTTVLVTEITTLPVTTFVPSTLFGTSCPPDVTPSFSEDPPTPTPDLPPSSSSESSSSPISTPSSMSRLTGSRSSSSYTGSGSILPSSTSISQDSEGGTNIAPIVGGAVGGALGLLALGLMTWFFFKKAAFGKSSKFDNIFNKADDLEHIGHIHPEKHVMAFQGAQQVVQNLGQNPNQPPAQNGTNGTQPTQGQQPGYQQGDPTGALDQTLNGGEYQPQGNENEGPDLDDIKRKHLRRLFGGNDEEQGQQAPHQMPQHNMPPPRPLSNGGVPPVAPFVVNQVYPPQQPQYSNPPNNGYHPHQAQVMQQGYYGAPSTLSSNPSVTSSTQYGSQYGIPPQPVGGPPPQTHGHAPSASVSSYGRSGSPVSVQNAQVLQVMNPETSYQYNHTQAGSSSSAGYPAASSAVPAYPTDGKGRPVNTMGEKSPIVHLDGGRYEEPGPSTSGTTHPPSGPPPPAYT